MKCSLNKKPQSLFLVITFILVLSPYLSQNLAVNIEGTWEIDDETVVNYTIEGASWGVQIGDQSIGGEGVNFKGVKIAPSNSFDVEVVNVDEQFGVEFIIDNSTATASGEISSDLFLFELDQFLYYPEQEALRLSIQGFNRQEIILGPGMVSWFFVEPEESLWEHFREIANIDYHKSKESNYDYEAYFESFFEIRENQAIFDMYMYGSFVNDTLEIDMNFNHNIKFVWDSLTGILLGYRISSSVSGSIEELVLSESIGIICKESSYSLPGFKVYNYSGFISGYQIAITFAGLSAGVIFSIFVKRKRKN